VEPDCVPVGVSPLMMSHVLPVLVQVQKSCSKVHPSYASVGSEVGSGVGGKDGLGVGSEVGRCVGAGVGASDGACDGCGITCRRVRVVEGPEGKRVAVVDDESRRQKGLLTRPQESATGKRW